MCIIFFVQRAELLGGEEDELVRFLSLCCVACDLPFEEMFIPLEGRWAVFWLDARGEYCQAILGPWDACWVPPGVQRGFRNAGREWGKLHVIQGQPGAPPPEYHRDYSELEKK